MTYSQELPLGEPEKIYSISEINNLSRDLLELNLSNIWLEGEISNYKLYPSGHHYFSLKDEKAEIRAVLFAGAAMGLRFKPESGMQVMARGKVTVYPERGQYQIIVESLKPAGVGKLQFEFDKLKQKLLEEGLFEREHKKPIPQFPESIAIITSSAGAAVRDIISIIRRRYPIVKLYVFPVKVQGEGAAQEIAAAIEAANQFHQNELRLDAVITGRGGGSIEDLWAFNEEIVARAIFESEIPVVSAVGHEIDFTIADFVADLRAPTPSAAAELVVPNRDDLISHLQYIREQMAEKEQERIENLRLRVRLQTQSYAFRRPIQRIEQSQQRLDHLSENLLRAYRTKSAAMSDRLTTLLGRLESVNPVAVMKRGYSIAETAEGNVVRSVKQVQLQEQISLNLQDGRLNCEVVEINHKQSKNGGN